jgi:uncharacterized DUF497 family protein
VAELRFSWDPRKARLNKRQHGVSFEDAEAAFLDERAILLDDPGHSGQEERFLLIGLCLTARVIVVSHCLRENETTIRIISARKATPTEREEYWERWKL